VVHDLHEHGGHSLYTKTLADDLAQRHEVTVFANYCERQPGANWRYQRVRAWRRNALTTVQTFPIGLATLANKLRDFDVVHTQGFCGGRPDVITAHICVAAYLDSLKSVKARSRASLRLMALAEARFYRKYQGRVIAVSQKIARELQEFYDANSEVEVIHHGVHAGQYAAVNTKTRRQTIRKSLGVANREVVALFVGDLTKAYTQLKAFAKAAPEVKLVIVSRSQRYHWSAPNVRYLNPTTAMADYYEAADVFVFPTAYDSFGMVVLEAMASGLPVFCSDQAGAAELITSGKDGFAFGLDEWVDATGRLMKEPAYLRQVGAEARNTAVKHCWPRVVESVEDVYRQALENKSLPQSAMPLGNGYRYQQ
jgi:UDP-glucose:(heptosyl)LPS alpha-1,3-glucosyltransferase